MRRHRSGLKCKVSNTSNILSTAAMVRHGLPMLLWPWWDLPMEIQPSSTFHETTAVPTAVWPLCPTFVCEIVHERHVLFSEMHHECIKFLTLQRLMENGVPPCQTKETNWNSGPNTLDFPSLSFTMRLGQQNTHVGGTCNKRQIIRNHREMWLTARCRQLKGFTVKLWALGQIHIFWGTLLQPRTWSWLDQQEGQDN